MHRVKASDLVSLRRSLADKQPQALAEVRSRMPDELREVLDATVASAWLPDPQICAIYDYFCRVLFPAAVSPYVQLGRHMALMSYRGVYRLFLKIPSTSFVISRAAAVWASYHSTGKASVEDVEENAAVLVVRGAEPICKAMIDVITGHILALAELTGGNNPIVHASAEDAAALRWTIRWK